MPEVVNLDALMPREDFLASDGPDAGSQGKVEAYASDLVKGASFYSTLRKPDFQRETAAWSPEAVRDFIRAFIEGDLIPSVICWQSPARLSFVIDGAHRLSAIMAWLFDDYGDGKQSIDFYNNNIPEEQKKTAKKTRDLVNQAIGSYAQFDYETRNPGSNATLTEKARALAFSKVPLLWIKGNDSDKAEKAFITINRAAVQIDPTELKILSSRTRPNAIAARVIVRNSTGHKYWAKFSEAGRAEVESAGREINKALYNPPLQTPIRSEELPIAGHGYGTQTLPLIFDFVNIANRLPVIDASKEKAEAAKKKKKNEEPKIAQEQPDEATTVQVLRNAEKLTRRFTSNHAGSLGLHPAVYFYASNGRHQPTAVLAVAELVMKVIEQSRLNQFTAARARFEQFLIDHKMFINQMTAKYGSMAKGYRQISEYFLYVLDLVIEDKSFDQVEENLSKHQKFRFLVKEKGPVSTQAKDFSRDVKQWAFLREALERSFECHICHARIDKKSMQLDHSIDLKHGGTGSGDNAKWAHPYCNSTYKDYASNLAQGI